MDINKKYGFQREVIKAIHEPSLDYGGRLSGYIGNKASETFDIQVFNEMSKLTDNQYTGGSWDMVETNNGGFFLCLEPDHPATYPMVNNNNYCNERVSVVAACLGANIITLNQAAWAAHSKGDRHAAQDITDLFYLLKEAVYDHLEAQAILRFID